MRALRFLKAFEVCLAVGAQVCVAAAALSHCIFLPNAGFVQLGALLAAPVIAGLSLLLPVRDIRAARAADACGLDERAQTALEFLDECAMCGLQREDALEKLRALEPRKALPYKGNRAPRLVLALSLIISGALCFLPNPHQARIDDHRGLKETLKEQADALEKAANAVESEAVDPALAALQKLARELAPALRAANDRTGALIEAGKAEETLRRIEQNRAETVREHAAGALKKAGLDILAEAVRAGERQQAQAAVEALASQARLSEAEAGKLADALNQAAAELSGAEEVKEALNQAAQTAVGAPSLDSALSALAGQLASPSLGAQAGGLARQIAGLRASLGSGGRGASGASGSSGTTGGSGLGPGEGAGSGAGTGSTNRDAGYSEGGARSRGGASGPSMDKMAQYEEIYDPTRLGGDGETSFVRGDVGEGEVNRVQLAPGQGDSGGRVPYRAVIGAYQQAAVQAAGDPAVPSYVKKWVDDYFTSLTDWEGE